MRPFYHRAEKYMDNHLFAEMQKMAKEKLKASVVVADEGGQSQTAIGQGFSQM